MIDLAAIEARACQFPALDVGEGVGAVTHSELLALLAALHEARTLLCGVSVSKALAPREWYEAREAWLAQFDTEET